RSYLSTYWSARGAGRERAARDRLACPAQRWSSIVVLMTAAKAQVSRPQAPAPSAAAHAPDDVGYFNGKDGTRLYCEWFTPAAPPRAAALILHGYAEHCGRYHEVARVLTGCGLVAMSYDFRG